MGRIGTIWGLCRWDDWGVCVGFSGVSVFLFTILNNAWIGNSCKRGFEGAGECVGRGCVVDINGTVKISWGSVLLCIMIASTLVSPY